MVVGTPRAKSTPCRKFLLIFSSGLAGGVRLAFTRADEIAQTILYIIGPGIPADIVAFILGN